MSVDERDRSDEKEQRTFSGRFPVRLPRYLHRELTQIAHEQGVSLNQFVCTAAARAAGLNAHQEEPASRPGANRVSEEEYWRILRDALR